MKLWVVLLVMLVAPACSGSRQEQREGDSFNQFSEHQGGNRSTAGDEHVARTTHHGGGSGGGWASGLVSGIFDFLFNSDTSDPSGP